MHLLAASLALIQTGLFAAVQNGSFEDGLSGWSTSHDWYAQPKGSGLSQASLAEGEGRNGTAAMKLAGDGKRGIVMQILPAYPGAYRVCGWVRCQGLTPGQAGVLVEWMDGNNKWMRGDWAGKGSGDQDWQRFETVCTAPQGTRSVHLDLLTTEPNRGTAWFDEVTFDRVPSGSPPPPAPVVRSEPQAAGDGELVLTWDPAAVGENTIRLFLFAGLDRLTADGTVLPKAIVDAAAGRATLAGLENGKTYEVAATALDADGRTSALGPAVRAQVVRRRPPRPGWLEAERSPDLPTVAVGWSPHLLDPDIRTLRFWAPGTPPQQPVPAGSLPVADRLAEPRPFYCTAAWVTADLAVPPEATQVGVEAENSAGIRSEIAWADIRPAAAKQTAPARLWTVPPTENVATTALPPAAPQPGFSLTLMRGQAKGYQVVLRPTADLHRVRVRAGALMQTDGKATIGEPWVAWHFVRTVTIERNSRATPKEELVWPAPAEYPDELSDDRVRDLARDRTEALYLRLTAPRDAVPGTYEGRGRIECDEGALPFSYRVRVLPADLPARPRLNFVYWFSWEETCKRFSVEPSSEDGWRVLGALGDLMRAHHQNAVVVSSGLIRSWRRPDGSRQDDFSEFDRFIRTFQTHGVDRLFCLSHIGSRTTGEWECPTMGSHRHTVRRTDTGETESVDLVELLPAIEQHVRELGLTDRFVVHVADEPIPKNVDSYRQLSARVRQAAPGLRRIDAIHVPDLRGALEVWVPQLNYFEQWLEQFRTAQSEGNEVWFYVAWVPQGKYPNRMIDGPACKPRVLHWLNALYDTTGYLHWALNHWQIPLTSLESPGDQYICWPSQRFVANSSLRYEAEREGLEDCELLFLVRDALIREGASRAEAQARVCALAGPAVQDFQHYTRSWEQLESVRGELLKVLIPGTP